MTFRVHEEYIDMFIAWQDVEPVIQYKENGYYIVDMPENKNKNNYLNMNGGN